LASTDDVAFGISPFDSQTLRKFRIVLQYGQFSFQIFSQLVCFILWKEKGLKIFPGP